MRKILFLLLFVITGITQINAQDSLSINDLIYQVVLNNLTLKQADQNIKSLEIEPELAYSNYLPQINGKVSYSVLGPIPSFAFGPEVIKLVPDYNFSTTVSVDQLVWDFGQTDMKSTLGKQNVTIEKERKNLTTLQLTYLVKQIAENIFYLKEVLTVQNYTLDLLKQTLQQVEILKQTGSAVEYDVVNTQVRVSELETQIRETINSKKSLCIQLQNILNQPATNTFLLKGDLALPDSIISYDSFLAYAMENYPQFKILDEQKKQIDLQKQMIDQSRLPSLFAFGQGGFANGIQPSMYHVKFNWVAGLNLNVNLFDGNRRGLQKEQFSIENEALNYQYDALKNNISSELKQLIDQFKTLYQNYKTVSLQLSQSELALELGKARYEAGVITNLDFLDVQNTVAQTKLLKLKIILSLVLTKDKINQTAGISLVK